MRETSTQRLSLFGNLGLRLLWEDGEDFDVTYADPAIVGGRFGQDWADGGFDAYLTLQLPTPRRGADPPE